MSIHRSRVFIDWLADLLEAGGLNVGRGEAPATHSAAAGYVVVYSIAGGVTRGSLDAPRSDAEPNVQISAVSLNHDQALALADRARSLVDAAIPATLDDGRRVIWLDYPMASPTLIRDDDVRPPKYTAIDRYEFGTTP